MKEIWKDINNVHKQRQIICLRPMTEWPPLHYYWAAATIIEQSTHCAISTTTYTPIIDIII